MAKTINDAQLSLAYRLGESAIPGNTTEVARRNSFFKQAIEYACTDRKFWFLKEKVTDATVADQPYYDFPDRVFDIYELKINGYQHKKLPREEVYAKYEAPSTPVPILPSYMERAYYLLGERYYPIPVYGSAPTAKSVSSITSTGGVATVTMAAAHGFSTGDYVTIAGANETDYNVKAEITVTSTTAFTYAVSNSPSSPATGTMTATKDNIELWTFRNPDLSSFDTSSSIVVPDRFESLLVSFAEFRYWSTAHKRGKAADAEAEFRDWLKQLEVANGRLKFGT